MTTKITIANQGPGAITLRDYNGIIASIGPGSSITDHVHTGRELIVCEHVDVIDPPVEPPADETEPPATKDRRKK